MKGKEMIAVLVALSSFLFFVAKATSAKGFLSPDAFVRVSSIEAENLTITVKTGEYQIKSEDKGQSIEMEEFGYLLVPGKPMLPAKSFLVALPPGARVQSVEVKGIDPAQLPGTYQIIPSPPILPLVDPLQYK